MFMYLNMCLGFSILFFSFSFILPRRGLGYVLIALRVHVCDSVDPGRHRVLPSIMYDAGDTSDDTPRSHIILSNSLFRCTRQVRLEQQEGSSELGVGLSNKWAIVVNFWSRRTVPKF